MSVRLAGIAWFSEVDYEQVRSVMVDAASLPQHYGTWLRGAETAERDLREQGHHPVRVAVVPADFLDWCGRRGDRTDARARREYAYFVLAEEGEPPKGT